MLIPCLVLKFSFLPYLTPNWKVPNWHYRLLLRFTVLNWMWKDHFILLLSRTSTKRFISYRCFGGDGARPQENGGRPVRRATGQPLRYVTGGTAIAGPCATTSIFAVKCDASLILGKTEVWAEIWDAGKSEIKQVTFLSSKFPRRKGSSIREKFEKTSWGAKKQR